MVEQGTHNSLVAGSIPACHTSKKLNEATDKLTDIYEAALAHGCGQMSKKLAETATEEDIKFLVSCGVTYSGDHDCLCMYV